MAALYFKKPKRNLRVRDSDELFDDENEEKINNEYGAKPPPKSNKSKESKKVSTLSFEDELNECDDGEEFKVRKSSYSKKIKKQMNKEKMGRNKVETEKKSKITTNNTFQSVIIKESKKNSEPVEKEIMLTGRDAEMAGYESSDEERDTFHPSVHRFSNPEDVKIVLKKGQIPNAALIHAARKRRQQARDMGEDFIPVSQSQGDTNNTEKEPTVGRRLTREEDELEDSDDDGRIVMSGIVSQAEDRKKSLHITMTDNANSDEIQDNDEMDEDDNDWETQQIRKGVTGSQLAAAQQESTCMNMYSNVVPHPAIPQVTTIMMEQKDKIINTYAPHGLASTMKPNEIVKKTNEILAELKEKQRPDIKYFEDMRDEIPEIQDRVEKLKRNVPELAECFQFYQDLRGYVTDLVECLDEKIPVLVMLEQRLSSAYEKRRSDLLSRRRLDVRDQADEAMPTSNKLGSSSAVPPRSEEQQRRAAEREGRRIRRMRNRELKAISKHADGMSTDEEVPETDAAALRSQIEVIKNDANVLMDDVLDEFASVELILRQMFEWKKKYQETYTEAYVNVCLPKLVGPYVRLEMLFWNPLEDNQKFEDMLWFKSMQKYTVNGMSNIEQLSKNVDLELIPKIIEKVVLTKLDQIVLTQWDPLSSKQTKGITCVIKNILDNYPTIDPDSKLLMALLTNIVDRLRDAVDNDVFIPIYPKQVMNSGRMNVFFQRQFNVAVKLLGNILCWHHIIEDAVLIDLAINQILNRYLLMSIRTLQPLEAILKVTMVAKLLPISWLSYGNATPKELTSFLNQSKLVAIEIDKSQPQAKLALDKLNEVLKL
ncbi:PAX3- and PAX7-binding protein 1 isoform X2 [Adelges cooleyi]|uniref:PAX3- and PAX7-binding protein 1 isoform X2 n=1 Tax=Adelges cooleyi TaxID=133065 RepID=UPI00217FBBDC|nr:PAX3- and PAX7-binding protein 1 isoform X2 [Adelges cooleyi]